MKGGIAVNQQSNIRIALASVPNIVGETPEDAAFRCDQYGMFMCSCFGALSENEKISSASWRIARAFEGLMRSKILHSTIFNTRCFRRRCGSQRRRRR